MMLRRGLQNIYFPWEEKLVLLSKKRWARLKFSFFCALVLGILFFLYQREAEKAATRATRASISNTYLGVMRYRADHQNACPKDVNELSSGHSSDAFTDAWGRPLRIVCPGKRDPQGFDVVSDGPDGKPFGLDRIE